MKFTNNLSRFTPKIQGKQRGFTILELMIVVAILSLLAAVTYPSYNQYVLRGNRSEGRAALLDTAAKLERFYSDNNRYATADDTFPALANFSTTTESGKYNLISQSPQPGHIRRMCSPQPLPSMMPSVPI